MDPIVIAAMAKWPNVPEVFGWLSLSARGDWRLRGERIENTALKEFIRRNYQADAHGRWFFQNGPQRVFVACEQGPLIATLQAEGILLHTGVATTVSAVWLDSAGSVWFSTPHGPASPDDRELEGWQQELQCNQAPATDEQVLACLAGENHTLQWRGLQVMSLEAPALTLGFVALPTALPTADAQQK